MDATIRTSKPQSNVLRYQEHPLRALFAPKTVAVVGASEKTGTVGRTILWNLVSSPFGGTVFPVNAKRSSILGIRAYPTVADVPEHIDLAIIVTPAPTVPGILRECGEAGVGTAIVTSPGFREAGPEGLELERQLLAEARAARIRVVGPNCLGVMSPAAGLNATFAPAIARPGSVGFISQSGALGAAVLDWSLRMNVGFSQFVSAGSMADVAWGDLIDYMGDDPRTRSIVAYMESIGDARAFLSAAREVALTKPIIVIKAGRTAAAARAAASHTGALAGSNEVLDAAFRRCGVLRVDSIADVFCMAEALGGQPRPKGPRLTIVTNAGGPGVLATDALIQNGGELAGISDDAMQAYNAFLPSEWSHSNPIDVVDDADPARFVKAVDVALNDHGSDGLLMILTPQALTDPTRTAEQVKQRVAGSEKPVLASWMGGAAVAAGESVLTRANIPTFPYPDTAARVFAMMWQYSDNLRSLYETPVLPAMRTGGASARERVEALVQQVRAEGRTLLTEAESRRVLADYGIPIVESPGTAIADETIRLAAQIDPQFGPVLAFGAGARHVDVYCDRALALPPLTTTLARRMMERTRIYHAMKAGRENELVDLTALEELLVRFSYLVAEQPWIREVDVNPVLVSAGRPLVLDARILAHDTTTAASMLPKLAIRPYPVQYVQEASLLDGTAITLRPIRPEDEPAMIRFHEGLSERSVYFRYFHMLNLTQRVAHERLTRICFIDYDREIALVAEQRDPATGENRIVAVGRLTRIHATRDAEFAVLVTDDVQGRGLGSLLVKELIAVARAEAIDALTGEMLAENLPMQHICERFGFTITYEEHTQMLRVFLDLRTA